MSACTTPPFVPTAAHLHPWDGSVLVLEDDTVWRWDTAGWTTVVTVPGAVTSAVTDAGVVLTTNAGGVYRYEDYTGLEFLAQLTGPAPLAPISYDYTGTLGWGGELLAEANKVLVRIDPWTPAPAVSLGLYIPDVSDLTVGDAIYAIDGTDVLRMSDTGQLTVLPFAVTTPIAIAWHGFTQRLLIADAATDAVWSFDPQAPTGPGELILSGADIDVHASLDTRYDGEAVLATGGEIVRFMSAYQPWGDPQPCDDPVDLDGDGLCDADPFDSCFGLDNGMDYDDDGTCDDLDPPGDPQPCDDPIDLDGDGLCDADPYDACFGWDWFGDFDDDGLCDEWGVTDLCRGDNSFGDIDGDRLCDEWGVTDRCEGEGDDADGDFVCDTPCFPVGVLPELLVERCGCLAANDVIAPGPDSDSDNICDSIDACHAPDDGACQSFDHCIDADGDGTCEPVCVDDDADGICDRPPYVPTLSPVGLTRADMLAEGRFAATRTSAPREHSTNAWTTLPDGRIAFLSAAGDDHVTIEFSADVEGPGDLDIRALVDTIATAPDAVRLSSGPGRGSRTARFVAPITAGVRHVAIQWRSLGSVTVHRSTTSVHTGVDGADVSSLFEDSAAVASEDWESLATTQLMGSDDHSATVGLASTMSTDGLVELRVLVDGLLAAGPTPFTASPQVRSHAWSAWLHDLPHGQLADIDLQWRRVGGTFATVTDRTLVARAAPTTPSRHNAASSGIGPVSSQVDWSRLVRATVSTQVPPNGEMVVRFEAWLDVAEPATEFRLRINDEAANVPPLFADNAGRISATWSLAHLPGQGHATAPADVWVEWRAPGGLSSITAHGLQAWTEPGVADVAPRSANSLLGELAPASGERTLIVLPVVTADALGNPPGPELVAAATPTVNEIIHGVNGVVAFYDDMSAGRLQLQAQVLPVLATNDLYEGHDPTLLGALEQAIGREGGDAWLSTLDVDGNQELDEVYFSIVWVTPTARQLTPTSAGVAVDHRNAAGAPEVGAYRINNLVAISTSADLPTVAATNVTAHELAHSLLGVHDAHTSLVDGLDGSTDWPLFEQGIQQGPFEGHVRGNVYRFDEARQIRAVSFLGGGVPDAHMSIGVWEEQGATWMLLQTLDLQGGAFGHREVFGTPPILQPGVRYVVGWFNDDPAVHVRDSRAQPDSGDPTVELLGHVEQDVAAIGDLVAALQPGAFLIRVEHEVVGRPALPIAHPLSQDGSTLMTGPRPLLWLDAAHRVKLGWAEPIIVRESGVYTLPDVNHEDRVLMLPRAGCGTEAFFLENRSTQTPNDHPLFDANHEDSGVAVWHFLESDTTVLWRNPPVCSEAFEPFIDVTSAVLQTRLLRPMDHPLQGRVDRFSSVTREDTLDDDPRLCWLDSTLDPGRQALRWADDAASGYHIDFLDVPGEAMQLQVTVDPLPPAGCP